MKAEATEAELSSAEPPSSQADTRLPERFEHIVDGSRGSEVTSAMENRRHVRFASDVRSPNVNRVQRTSPHPAATRIRPDGYPSNELLKPDAYARVRTVGNSVALTKEEAGVDRPIGLSNRNSSFGNSTKVTVGLHKTTPKGPLRLSIPEFGRKVSTNDKSEFQTSSLRTEVAATSDSPICATAHDDRSSMSGRDAKLTRAFESINLASELAMFSVGKTRTVGQADCMSSAHDETSLPNQRISVHDWAFEKQGRGEGGTTKELRDSFNVEDEDWNDVAL